MNIYRGSASDWERHQRDEIDRFVHRNASESGLTSQFEPLYPGSMLFNQIAVINNNMCSEPALFSKPGFETLDTVYEALGISAAPAVNKDTLLVDCQSWWDDAELFLHNEFEIYLEQQSGNHNIVFLSGRYNARIKGICEKLAIKCSVITPNWWCAASLISLYRGSAHVLFVDTARSLDAAMIGVNCSLIVSENYAMKPVFLALFQTLSTLSCCKVILPQITPVANRVNIAALENRADALLLAMNVKRESESAVASAASVVAGCESVRGNSAGYESAQIISTESEKVECHSVKSGSVKSGSVKSDGGESRSADPVVRSGVFWQQLWKQKIANVNVSARRKTRKLLEDPRAFFMDSQLPGSRSIAAIFPETG